MANFKFRPLFYLLGVVLAFGAFFGYGFYKKFYAPNVPSELTNNLLQVPSGTDYEGLVNILNKKGFLKDTDLFKAASEYKKFDKFKVRAGQFKIKEGWSNNQLINFLRVGEQTPVNVVMNGSERLLDNVAGKVSRFIEADSVELYKKFHDVEYLTKIGYDTTTLMTLFIPNSYEMYWNTNAEKFVERMIKEHDAFWKKNDREAKAKALNLTPTQVYTLASIVERETLSDAEKPRIAGVYLNRLNIGMKLQADPTSVFATRDFDTHRVTTYHTNFDSPFNTYMYKGLPPGPISMAGIPSIDAVLSPEKHNYIYFCAKVDDSGTHAFAETFAQHNVNVDKYKEWLAKRGF